MANLCLSELNYPGLSFCTLLPVVFGIRNVYPDMKHINKKSDVKNIDLSSFCFWFPSRMLPSKLTKLPMAQHHSQLSTKENEEERNLFVWLVMNYGKHINCIVLHFTVNALYLRLNMIENLPAV